MGSKQQAKAITTFETITDIHHLLLREIAKLGLIETALSTMQGPERVSLDDIMGAEYLVADISIKLGMLADRIDGIRYADILSQKREVRP